MKKKRHYISISLIVIFVSFLLYTTINFKDSELTEKKVIYNGNSLLISIDGIASSTLPTRGDYYLVDYDCKSLKTKLSWDRENNELNITNGTNKASVSCYLEFESNPKLSDMPVGSYVAYIGEGGIVGNKEVTCQNDGNASSSMATSETEAPNSCAGQNAREDIDSNGNTYGYCYDSKYKYYTTGWRIAYIDNNNKPVIVSAGSPECNVRTSSTANENYIQMANAKALKYCNTDYVDGNCTCVDDNGDGLCDMASSDIWAISDTDFYYMTKAISGYGKRLTSDSSSLGDNKGTLEVLYCHDKLSYKECGYNNDLIDNGGYYWFSSLYNFSSTDGVNWNPSYRTVSNAESSSYAYGLRPMISLSSFVYVTGGSGTVDDPYTIANYNFLINNGVSFVTDDDKDSVKLSMIGDNIASMCISVNSSVCTNYIDFSTTYTLDWSSETNGEKVVYVYYKDSDGKIVASLNKSIMLDGSQ